MVHPQLVAHRRDRGHRCSSLWLLGHQSREKRSVSSTLAVPGQRHPAWEHESHQNASPPSTLVARLRGSWSLVRPLAAISYCSLHPVKICGVGPEFTRNQGLGHWGGKRESSTVISLQPLTHRDFRQVT